MVAQWEQQIAEIIQWVNDEKDARGYLQVSALHFLIKGLFTGFQETLNLMSFMSDSQQCPLNI